MVQESAEGMKKKESQAALAMDAFAWGSNVICAVLIVFVNKMLMKGGTGYGFHFATALTALHYVSCTLGVWGAQALDYIKPAAMPRGDLALFTAVADVSILTLNLSLMINTVSFYQIAKLLVIPFVCFVERVWLGRTFTRETTAAIGTVVLGVAVVTVEDLHMDITLGGLLIAALSVVSSGMQQILVRVMQHKNKLSSHELLSNTAPAQAWTLALVAPFIDKLVSKEWVFRYSFTSWGLAWLIGSCLLAVMINVSQFMCLGRFTAVTFQVLGHTKTILVLLGGWLFLGDSINTKKGLGMSLAVAGMVWYGKASSKPAEAPTPVPLARSGSGAKLLPIVKVGSAGGGSSGTLDGHDKA